MQYHPLPLYREFPVPSKQKTNFFKGRHLGIPQLIRFSKPYGAKGGGAAQLVGLAILQYPSLNPGLDEKKLRAYFLIVQLYLSSMLEVC
jgi:hypothetical protein